MFLLREGLVILQRSKKVRILVTDRRRAFGLCFVTPYTAIQSINIMNSDLNINTNSVALYDDGFRLIFPVDVFSGFRKCFFCSFRAEQQS